MPQAWMVRAGERGKIADAFSRGVVAIAWAKTGSLGKAKSRDAVRDIYSQSYPNAKAGQIPGDVAMLFKFRVVMCIGDRVVTYDARHKEYLVGSITSGYIYDPKKITGYPHIRRVKWENRVQRNKLPEATRNSLGSTLTIFTIEENIWSSIAAAIGNDALHSETFDPESSSEDFYYRMFPEVLRHEALTMKNHYELFYCLERYIRELITTKLSLAHGNRWWDLAIPLPIKDNVGKNIQREQDAGVTRRSKNPLDYTTFGELGDIVRNNWDTFSQTFNNQRAFSRIMNSLNVLRAPIAHSCPLADDEVDRLKLTIKDWFRLIE